MPKKDCKKNESVSQRTVSVVLKNPKSVDSNGNHNVKPNVLGTFINFSY